MVLDPARSFGDSDGRNFNVDECLDTVYQQHRDTLSVTTINSTATASDLPGAGRLLGNLYSKLGRALERLINRFALRAGYGPVAIQERVLGREFPISDPAIPEPGSKREKKLRKDLKRLIAYAQSEVESNRELAFSVIMTVAIAGPYFRELLRQYGAMKVLALICLHEEMDGFDYSLLSPSRKALICVGDSNICTLGKKWVLLRSQLASQSPTLYMPHSIGPPDQFKIVKCDPYNERYFETYLNAYIELGECISKFTPEQSVLAMQFFSGFTQTRVRREINRTLTVRHSHFFHGRYSHVVDNAELLVGAIHRTSAKLAESIFQKVTHEPENVDWTILGFTILRLQAHSLVPTTSKVQQHMHYCPEIVDNILSHFSDKFSPDMTASIQIMNDALKRAKAATPGKAQKHFIRYSGHQEPAYLNDIIGDVCFARVDVVRIFPRKRTTVTSE